MGSGIGLSGPSEGKVQSPDRFEVKKKEDPYSGPQRIFIRGEIEKSYLSLRLADSGV